MISEGWFIVYMRELRVFCMHSVLLAPFFFLRFNNNSWNFFKWNKKGFIIFVDYLF